MKKVFLTGLLAVALAALFASCILITDPEGEPGWRTTPDSGALGPGSEFRQTFESAPGRTLSLQNDYGDVMITGWDRDQVEVVARAATVEPQPQSSARQYRIRKTTPQVKVEETEDGLLVRTPTFEGPGEAPAVDYEVSVPNSVILTGIRVSEGNITIADVFGRIEAFIDQGDLSISNYSGAVRATVGTGNADVEVLDLRDRDEISVTSRKGDISLRLESGVNAIVEADAPRGEVSSDFDLGVKLPAPTVKGWIGQGGPAVFLRASDGLIKIIKTAETAAPAARPAGK